jgi:hypothetical protein
LRVSGELPLLPIQGRRGAGARIVSNKCKRSEIKVR